MIFFVLHQIVQKILGNLSEQTRNLITFLLGVVLYTLLWTYVNTTKSDNFIVASIRYGFYYIFVSDCFAMGIIYKNYYNRSITTEVSSAWGNDVSFADTKKNSTDYVNIEKVSTQKSKVDTLPAFQNSSNEHVVMKETTDEILNETPSKLLEEINIELEEENENDIDI